MDTAFSSEDLKFQSDVREFISHNYPKELKDSIGTKRKTGKELSRDDLMSWHKILGKHNGWSAPGWPKQYGGAEFSPTQKYIFEQECARAECQYIMPFGVNMVGPVIYTFGNDEQKAKHLPGILSGDVFWCQGYSEPGSGSDLASLKTSAVKEGDHYIVNGQKTWTTLGQHANKIFCLVRTSGEGKPQEGISFVLVDIDTPGIDMRPIRLIEGGHEVNEVFFTDVRVPVSNLVGEENKGWTIAKFLLSHERTGIAGVGFSMQALEEVKTLAHSIRRGAKRLIDDPLFSARLANVVIDLDAMKITNLRMLFQAQKQGAPGPETSMLKIKGTVINQELRDLARRALGPTAAPFPGHVTDGNILFGPADTAFNAARYFNNRKTSIFGGSNEIQRNILTKTMLEL